VNAGREVAGKIPALHKVNVGPDRDERLPESQALQHVLALRLRDGGGGEGGGGEGEGGEQEDDPIDEPSPDRFHQPDEKAFDLRLLAQLILLNKIQRRISCSRLSQLIFFWRKGKKKQVVNKILWYRTISTIKR
jgi:hypothetical protein